MAPMISRDEDAGPSVATILVFLILNETWFKAEKVGTYYGQCSELCGIQHAFMPITVRVVTDEEYAIWLAEAKMKFANEPITENEYKKLASK